MNINQFLKMWKQSNEEDRKQVAHDIWYDWFCADKSLYNRTKKFVPFLKAIVKQNPKIGEMEVSGKNCCPVNYPLYDCMRIFDNDKFMGCISFDSYNGKYSIMDQNDEYHNTDDKKEAVSFLLKAVG